MIVIGIDPHMKSHTAVALDGASARRLAQRTVAGDTAGAEELLARARGLGGERLFAIEDGRQVSGRLERHLLGCGEHLVRVPPKPMAKARSSARSYGKSDPIDAECVARAALRQPHLPEAHRAGPECDVRLLSDHRDDLLGERRRAQSRLRWHLHDLECDLALPPRALDRSIWLDRVERRLRGLRETTRRRIALELVARCRELTAAVRALEREIRVLMRKLAPELLALPGCSALSAAQLAGRVGGASRFSSEAAFAMHTGTAPLPASSAHDDAPPPQPARQPAPQLGHPRHGRHPGAHAPAGDSLPRAQAGGGHEHPRGTALPQAPHRTDGLQDDAASAAGTAGGMLLT